MKVFAMLAGIGFAALAVTSSLTIVAPAQAQRWEDCRERIRNAERHLDRVIDRFGRRSWQARDARHALERTREWCYAHHRRDWDRHDNRPDDRRDNRRHHDGWGH